MNITLKVPQNERSFVDFLIRKEGIIDISPREGGWNITCSNDNWLKWLDKKHREGIYELP